MLKLTFLGTSSGIPTLERNMSCVALEMPSKRVWLVDCGAGTQHQLLKAGMWIGRIDKIFITHLHGDHCYDIVGLLALRGMRKVLSPVEVIGPVGIKELIETTKRLSSLYLPFEVKIIELTEGCVHDLGWRSHDLPAFEPHSSIDTSNDEEMDSEVAAPSNSRLSTPSTPSVASPTPSTTDSKSIEPDSRPASNSEDGSFEKSKTETENEDWHIVAYPLNHRVSCFGYVFTEKMYPGSFDSKLAIAKGAAGKEIAKLAKGEKITLTDGTVLSDQDCLRPAFPGRKIVVLGDTHICSSELHAGAALADVLVHETTFEAGFDELALRSKHSTTHMAVDCALASQAKHLIITHFSARYSDYGALKTVPDLLAEAQAHAKGAMPISAAQDFWSFEVPPKKEPHTHKK